VWFSVTEQSDLIFRPWPSMQQYVADLRNAFEAPEWKDPPFPSIRRGNHMKFSQDVFVPPIRGRERPILRIPNSPPCIAKLSSPTRFCSTPRICETSLANP